MSMQVLADFIENDPPTNLRRKGKISKFRRTRDTHFEWEYRREDGVWEDVDTDYLVHLLTAPDLKKYLLKFASH